MGRRPTASFSVFFFSRGVLVWALPSRIVAAYGLTCEATFHNAAIFCFPLAAVGEGAAAAVWVEASGSVRCNTRVLPSVEGRESVSVSLSRMGGWSAVGPPLFVCLPPPSS